MAYTVTVDDPVYYTKPWTNERTFTLTTGELIEYSCQENNRSLLEGRIKLWTVPGSEPLRNPVLGKQSRWLNRSIEIATRIGIPVARRHIFLCAEQTKPKCCDMERGVAAWDFLKRASPSWGCEPGRHPALQGQLPAHLRGRSDRRRLSRGRVVSRVRSAGARADHSGTPDRRADRRRPADYIAPSRRAVTVTQDLRRARRPAARLHSWHRRRTPGTSRHLEHSGTPGQPRRHLAPKAASPPSRLAARSATRIPSASARTFAARSARRRPTSCGRCRRSASIRR